MASPTLPSPLLSSPNLRTFKPARAHARPWWAPLFHGTLAEEQSRSEEREMDGGFGTERNEGGSPAEAVKFSALTAEKARVLRREMRATETWHDAMYHSAIASRLAFQDQA